jgi:hypothetical protein
VASGDLASVSGGIENEAAAGLLDFGAKYGAPLVQEPSSISGGCNLIADQECQHLPRSPALDYMSVVPMQIGPHAQQLVDVVRFTGCNVQVVDGSGDTFGETNGTGNLIVGYNENAPPVDLGIVGGSHNIIAGVGNSYGSFGGLVVGRGNYLEGEYASISGGQSNWASGAHSSISGGCNQIADEPCQNLPCNQCPADTNVDGVVNVDDLLAVIMSWGAACP